MSTNITADNGAEIKVGQFGMGVVHPEGIASIWARLSDAQRVELAAALDPGRRGLHVRLDNQAATLATYRRERDEALRKKGEAFDRAVRAERELDAAVARADQLRDERDDAIQSCIAVGRERDEAQMERADALRERDAAVARAEAAEMDRVRAVLDQLADQTEPPCNHATWVYAYREAVDAISRIAYPKADQ